MVLESLKIPVVLGNGWLCAHKAVVQANRCTVLLTASSRERIEYQGSPLETERMECKGGLLQPEEVDELLEEVHTKGANMNNGIATNNVEGQSYLVEVDAANKQTCVAHPIGILGTGRRMHNGMMRNVCKIQWSNQTEEEAWWEDKEDMRTKFPYVFE